MSAYDDVATARRLLSPHFATDGEEDGPEAERIATAVETLIGSIAEALSVARVEGQQGMVSDLPEPIRHHTMDTLASVAQSIRSAYCWALARNAE